jgi:predicted dehydrogenase
MNRKLRFGMIGGGQGAFIGAVHRIAAFMDGKAELVAGAFSSDAARSRASGAELCVDPARTYASFVEMAKAEKAMPADRRLDFVVIVTPNHMHFPPAKLFLESGFNVVCDKPVTFNLAEAKKLRAIVKKSKKVFVLTHNYTGNVMVKQARDLVRDGKLGELRKVVVEYPQGWLHELVEASGQKQASWRTDPKRSGAAGCLGDIGTHAENLARYITGLHIDSLCADLTAFVKGRKLDDNDGILLRWKGGAKGMLWASQVAPGNENGLSLRVYGTKGGLSWRQENPNLLWFTPFGQPPRLVTRGGAGSGPEAGRVTRVPPGHPEGYLEGFANIYAEAARAIRAARNGKKPDKGVIYPTVEDGLKGMQFVEAAVKSSARGGKWVKV